MFSWECLRLCLGSFPIQLQYNVPFPAGQRSTSFRRLLSQCATEVQNREKTLSDGDEHDEGRDTAPSRRRVTGSLSSPWTQVEGLLNPFGGVVTICLGQVAHAWQNLLGMWTHRAVCEESFKCFKSSWPMTISPSLVTCAVTNLPRQRGLQSEHLLLKNTKQKPANQPNQDET